MVTTRAQQREAQPGFFGRHSNVFCYVPNLIGYARVVCALYAFAVALSSPSRCAGAYFLSFVCDELDGRFARLLGQTSTFGAVLDMVTDRLATTCLLAVLCVLYPGWHLPFLLLIMLDVFSHWFQMYASLAAGSTSHKDVDSRSWVVRLYYRHRLFMGFCCISCEVLYLSLYILHWPQYRAWALVPLPAPLRPLLNGHLSSSSGSSGGLPLVALIAVLVVPGVLVKQLVNVVQLRTAAVQLAELDQRPHQRAKRG